MSAIRTLRLHLMLADTADQGREGSLSFLVDRVGELRIVIHPREHGVPHFHVELGSGENAAVYRIDTLERLEGRLPSKLERAVKQWGQNNRALLQNTWDSMRPTDIRC